MYGMYPLGFGLKDKEEFALPQGLVTVPVHTVPVATDSLLLAHRNCPLYVHIDACSCSDFGLQTGRRMVFHHQLCRMERSKKRTQNSLIFSVQNCRQKDH